MKKSIASINRRFSIRFAVKWGYISGFLLFGITLIVCMAGGFSEEIYECCPGFPDVHGPEDIFDGLLSVFVLSTLNVGLVWLCGYTVKEFIAALRGERYLFKQ